MNFQGKKKKWLLPSGFIAQSKAIVPPSGVINNSLKKNKININTSGLVYSSSKKEIG